MKKFSRLIVVLLGPPGAGKGTQSEMLHKEFGVPHLSTGDILRDSIKQGTKIGKEAQNYMHKGELVPDDIVFNLIESRVNEDDCANGAIFDGFPRNLSQAKNFLNLEYVKNADLVTSILVNISDADAVKRLSSRRYCPKCNKIFSLAVKPPKLENGTYICDNCGTELEIRDDDKIETIKNRLSVYHSFARPMLDLFDERAILRIVDGNQESTEVSKLIIKELS